ncbi:MAG: T9SS type A sorting domain-containing protein [Candidatus Cloacimonetes bacterium]|nr:T9SS type A sorting domain-containing protein [Candidatus Cloacimonadota bacterium]
MFKKYLFLVILIISFAFTNLLASNNYVIRFDNPNSQIIDTFNALQYDVAAFKPGEFLDIVVTPDEHQQLLDIGYDARITQTEEQLVNNLNDPTDLNGYIDYEEMLDVLQQIEIDNPDICKLYDIGDSRGKQYSDAGNSNYDNYYHEVWALKVSDNVEVEEDEPSIYYLSEHHAREPISLEVNMAVLNHIIDNYDVDPEITENVNNTQIWFVPLVNPDGHKIVTDEIYTMWRKNICDNNENGSINVTGYYAEDGVDPNRNYGWEWGGASNDWTSETYQGLSAFSEPETQAVQNLIDSHHFVAGISYHSYSELVLYPYGYSDGVIAPDQAALEELAIDMAVTIPGQSGGNYTPMPGWDLYPCTGTTDDYTYGTHGVFSFTIELAEEFIPPAGQVEGICDDNIEAAMILLNRLNSSTLRGHITDADTGDPIEAMIFVEGIDDSGVYREPYMSSEEFGSYYRFFTDGTYDVTFSAYGYDSQTFENVIIDDDVTILDIALVLSSNTIDLSGVITDGDTGEPISNATIAIQEFGIPSVTTNEYGEYLIEDLFEYDYTFAVYSPFHAGLLEQHNVNVTNNEIDFELFAVPSGTFEDGVYASSWMFEGNNNWVIDDVTVFSGNYSARSGTIYDDETSSLLISLFVSADSEISFYQKVSSEANYDYLRFYIDNVLQESWSGNGSWTFELFDVVSGFHIFEWEYYKDGGVSSYQDCGWIDSITFPSSSFIVTPTVLEFLDESTLDGLEFSVINNTNDDIIINDLEDTGGDEFNWFINDFNLSLPYTMSAGEQLDFLVMIALPVDNLARDIVSDVLDINTSAGDFQVEIFFDNNLYSSSGIEIPAVTKFNGNYPNPFNPVTTFSYSLANESKVDLTIFNIKGQKVKTLIDEKQVAGVHQVIWDGTDENGKYISTGIYFSHCSINSGDGDYTSVKKIILLK